jgi:hypothetical protein
MDFKIGGYKENTAFFLNSTGIFGLAIKPDQKNKNHQNIIIRIEKERKQTIVNFESSTIAQNSQQGPLKLFALQSGTNEPKIITSLKIPSNKVRVIPLEWFEENYLIFVDNQRND